jgi:hypothetical protein
MKGTAAGGAFASLEGNLCAALACSTTSRTDIDEDIDAWF